MHAHAPVERLAVDHMHQHQGDCRRRRRGRRPRRPATSISPPSAASIRADCAARQAEVAQRAELALGARARSRRGSNDSPNRPISYRHRLHRVGDGEAARRRCCKRQLANRPGGAPCRSLPAPQRADRLTQSPAALRYLGAATKPERRCRSRAGRRSTPRSPRGRSGRRRAAARSRARCRERLRARSVPPMRQVEFRADVESVQVQRRLGDPHRHGSLRRGPGRRPSDRQSAAVGRSARRSGARCMRQRQSLAGQQHVLELHEVRTRNLRQRRDRIAAHSRPGRRRSPAEPART